MATRGAGIRSTFLLGAALLLASQQTAIEELAARLAKLEGR